MNTPVKHEQLMATTDHKSWLLGKESGFSALQSQPQSSWAVRSAQN